MDFGDYCMIEQKRFGVPNEWYVHKVIGRFSSNAWIDTPIAWNSEQTTHKEMDDVLNVICCGVVEDKVIQVRASDCKPVESGKLSSSWRGAGSG
jgi:hypothetical protein